MGELKKNLSSVPDAPTSLRTTVDYWQQTNREIDQGVDLKDGETSRRLAVLYYENQYDEFEPFLYEAGVMDHDLPKFKESVFREMIKQDFLTRQDVLAEAISTVLVTFDFSERKLIQILEGLEEAYKSMLPQGLLEDDKPYQPGGIFMIKDLVSRIVELNK
jgi:hypothetical protein